MKRFISTGFILIIHLFSIPTFAGGWHETFYPNGTHAINKIATQDFATKEIYAVGDNGAFAFSKDGGNSWIENPTPTAQNLHDICVIHFPDTVLIAVGEGGTVLKSIDKGMTWIEDNLGPENLNAIAFDGTRFWIGGNNSNFIYSTPDLGNTWEVSTITDGMMNVTSLISTIYGVYATAIQGNTTYILAYDGGQNDFDTVDMLPDIILNSCFEDFSNLYFAGFNVASAQAAIVIKNDLGGGWGAGMPFNLTDIDVEITSINGMFDQNEHLWIATANGNIYESDGSASNFIPVYQNMEGNEIRTIAVRPNGAVENIAWAGGTQGLMLKYDFGVMFVTPPANGFTYPAENVLQIRFTSKPDLFSIKTGVYIHSNIQGRIPFDPLFTEMDSTLVELHLIKGTVPGEKLTVILSNLILEENSPVFIEGFSYDINVIPFGPSELSFNSPLPVNSILGNSTNFITGFFNEDDSFDLITFARDTLICFAGDGTGGFNSPEKIELGPIIGINAAIDQQLKAVDFNNDGKLDLVLYDDVRIQNIVNISDVNFNFVLADFYSDNISDVEFISVDNDSSLDFIILNDSLHIRTGIDESTFGDEHSGDVSPGWIKITVGDIDADGFKDIAAINSVNEIILRHSNPMGGFDMDYPIMGNYTDVQLADIDSDGFLDVLALENGDVIRVFKYIPFWSFSPEPSINQMTPNPLHTFDVYDYNGDNFMDVIMATTAREIKLFENMGGGFNELSEKQQSITIDPTGLIHGDFDQDGFLDIAAYDKTQGDFQVILKTGGPITNQVLIDSFHVQNGQVILSWNEVGMPGEIGFYRIYRDTSPGTMNFLTDIDTTFFIDNTVNMGQRYWYQVEAFDTSGSSIGISMEMEIEVLREISGALSGVLNDLGGPYIVTASIEVSEGSSLQIMPGVELIFENGADFKVYGDLQIMGSEQNFVSFKGKDDQSTWPGILISGLVNTDTIKMSYIDVQDADRAFRIENRPLKITYAGIMDNNIAFDVSFSGGSFDGQNIIIFNNNTGIQAATGANINLKNITLIQNLNEAIIIDDPSSMRISNSIIWENNNNVDKGPDIRSNSLSNVDIRYSTVDSLQGNFSLFNVSSIPPIFQPITDDSLAFFPDTLSPTIDAGDPADDYSAEPMPNGGRINQGVYGGTSLAVPTFQPRIEIDQDTLFFAAQLGQSDIKSLTLSNKGNVDLNISSIDIHLPEFTYAADISQSIPPGESTIVDIAFTPSSRITYEDLVFIDNNDPHIPKPGFPVVLEGTGLNTPPLLEGEFSDTLIYTYVPFDFTVNAQDFDGDTLLYTDDTPLFNIDQSTGQIQFTPTINDTGTHSIKISIDDGFVTVTDSFRLHIELNSVNPALNLTVTPGDQKLTLNWMNPANQFYSGTLICLDTDETIDHVDSCVAKLDTVFFINSSVQFEYKNLEIAKNYIVSIQNYFNPDTHIYSPVTQISTSTLAPEVQFDFLDRQMYVPPSDTLTNSLKVKNEGGGTLYCNFSYSPNALLDSWFEMDTTRKVIAPFDSTEIGFRMYPSESMNDIEHSVMVKLETNQPGWVAREARLKMHILFDRNAPRVSMMVQPDSLHKFSAIRFQFTANDTVDTLGWQIGDPTDSLRIRYNFIKLNSLTDYEILNQDSDRPIAPLDFYPLEDGLYRFDLWVYDKRNNGFADNARSFQKYVLVVASVAQLTSRRWYLASFPRDTNLTLSEFFPDSSAIIYRWHNEGMRYISYADSSLKSGEGVWILTLKSHWIDVKNFAINRQVDSSSVQLDQGWNQIGIPAGHPVHFGKMRFQPAGNENILSITEAVEQKLLAPAVYWYRSSYLFPGYEWNLVDSTVAYPWRGYWVYAPEGGNLIYSFDPVFPSPKKSEEKTDISNVLTKASINDWRLSLTIQSDKYSDRGNIIGISDRNENLPVFEPPHLSEHCGIYFSSDKGKITRDLRAPFEAISEVKEWDLKVTSSSIGKNHEISWAPWSQETGVYIYLIDAEKEVVVNLNEQESYQFRMDSKQKLFKIYATQDANFSPKIIPHGFKLLQNYPNPFNPDTKIKFGIPSSAEGKKISLKVYNILGQEIATLIDDTMPSGYHEIVWKGLNSANKRVASGIYFYRLISGDHNQVRKMVMLK